MIYKYIFLSHLTAKAVITSSRSACKDKTVIRLSLLTGLTRLTNVALKCSDLLYKIFTLNKRIRLTSMLLGKLRRVADKTNHNTTTPQHHNTYQMENIIKLFRVLDQWKWRYALAGCLLILAMVVSMLVPKILQMTIDGVVLFALEGEATTNKPDAIVSFFYSLIPEIRKDNLLTSLAWIGLLFVVISAIRSGTQFLSGVITADSTERAIKRLRDTLFSHIQAMPATYFGEVPSGDLIQRSTGDVDTVKGFIGNQVVSVIRFTAFFFGAFWMMYIVHPVAAFIAVCLVPVIAGTAFLFFMKERKMWEEHEAEQDKLTAIIQENLSGIRVVKAFGNQDFEIEKFKQQNEAKLKIGVRQVDLHTFFWPLSDFLVHIQIVLGIVGSAYFTLTGALTIGEFTAFFAYSIMVAWPMRESAMIMSKMGMAAVAMGRISQILDAKEEDYSGKINDKTQVVRGDIEFRNVSFKYKKEDDTYALRNVSFKIRAGEKIAFMGATGSGKSTVIALLARFYEPDEGEILLDGQPLHFYEKQYLRSRLGIVHQKPFLFSTTIKKNIAYTRPQAQEGLVLDAAKAADVETFIDKMTKGYDTLVGEKGVTLSGGQKQRVALARTLMSDPDILVLDDATSAVDTETEYDIQQALREKMRGKTSIIIAHRLTAVQEADRIIVFDTGSIAQMGTHDELLIQKGFYKKIYDIQVAVEDEIRKTIL